MMMVTHEPVCVIDEDPEVREKMSSWLRGAGYRVFKYPNGCEFLAEADKRETSCLVMDMELSDMNGLNLQRALATLGRREQIIFLSNHPSIPACVAAMRGGAVDYQLKPVEKGSLLSAVAEGVRRSAEVAVRRDACRRAAGRLAFLTRREREVMELLIQGHTNRSIGNALGAAESTIKIHRRHIMEKAGVRSLPELVVLAREAVIRADVS